MKIHFQLLAQGKSHPVILLKIYDARFKGRFCKVSTGYTIEPAHWDKRKERAKPIITKAREYNALNVDLDKLQSIVVHFQTLNRHASSLSRNSFREFVRLEMMKVSGIMQVPVELKSDFFDTWKKIIAETKNPIGAPISKNTQKSKQQTLNLVKKFSTSRIEGLSFETIDMNFYHELDSYMTKAGLSPNSKGKHFKEIKAIVREAADRDFKVNTAYQKKSFKVIRTQPDSVFLNEEELKIWWQLRLPAHLELRRDTFLMACYVGTRFCDWHQMNPRNVSLENGKEILKIRQQKTNDVIHIPVHPVVKMVFKKYGDNLPKIISNQKFNEALKEIGKLADMGLVTIDKKMVPKWGEVSSHTARRSFATNAYLSRSMDVYQIMKCTGHKTESSFLRYLKLNGKDFAIQAADAGFFTNNSFSMVIAS